FSAIVILFFSQTCNSQSWSSLGGGMNGYGTPWVEGLAVYGGNLIASGNFLTVGGISANFIAQWNGTSWSSMVAGMNTSVYVLTDYSNDLIAGGHFTKAGGVYANYIAKWNGSSWSPLGSGMNYDVYALTVYNGEL